MMKKKSAPCQLLELQALKSCILGLPVERPKVAEPLLEPPTHLGRESGSVTRTAIRDRIAQPGELLRGHPRHDDELVVVLEHPGLVESVTSNCQNFAQHATRLSFLVNRPASRHRPDTPEAVCQPASQQHGAVDVLSVAGTRDPLLDRLGSWFTAVPVSDRSRAGLRLSRSHDRR